MNAMAEPLGFAVPKRPQVREKEAPPPPGQYVVLPKRCATDPRLTAAMLRVLLLIASYANRAGITWVSQRTIARVSGKTQQAISKQVVQLIRLGYLEVVTKHAPALRSATWRVIFDPAISADEAIAIASSVEDSRPPHQQLREEAAMQTPKGQPPKLVTPAGVPRTLTEVPLTPDPAGQRKVQQLLASAFARQSTATQPTPRKEYAMPKEDTIAVRQVKEAMKEARARQGKAIPQQDRNLPKERQPGVVKEAPKGGISTTSRGCEGDNFQELSGSTFLRKGKEVLGYSSQPEIDTTTQTRTPTRAPTPTPEQPDCPPELAPLDGDSYRSLLEAGLPPDVVAELAPFAIDAWRSEGVNPSAKQVATVIRHMWSGDR